MTEVKVFTLPTNVFPDIKNHVFIPMQVTKILSELITNECWGHNNVLLYKYLDYIWRFQLIEKQIKLYTKNGQKRLVFNTGLTTKHTNESVYLGLITNKPKKKSTQQWRVHFGCVGSFLTKTDLIIDHGFNLCDIPKSTNYFNDKRDTKFHLEYSFVVNMNQHFVNMKSRITKLALQQIGIKHDNNVVDAFKSITKESLCNNIQNAIIAAKKNIDIIGIQAFVERDMIDGIKLTTGYHLELIIPLTLTFNNKNVYFAIVLRPDHDLNVYNIYAIISRKVAYINSRLVSPVTLSWLKPFATSDSIQNTKISNNNNNNNNNNTNSNKNIIYNDTKSNNSDTKYSDTKLNDNKLTDSKEMNDSINNNDIIDSNISVHEYVMYISMMYFIGGTDFVKEEPSIKCKCFQCMRYNSYRP